MFTITGETLRSIKLFSELDLTTRDLIASYCTARRFAPGQAVISQNDTSEHVHLLISGSVSVTIYAPSGKAALLQDKGAGEIIGELSAIDGKSRSAYAIANEETIAAVLSREDFVAAVIGNPTVAKNLLEKLVGDVRILSSRIFEFTTMAVANRVQAELLRLARKQSFDGNQCEILDMPTHAEIANRISSHREAVTKEINRLVKIDILEKSGRHLVVRDVDKLQSLVQSEYKAKL